MKFKQKILIHRLLHILCIIFLLNMVRLIKENFQQGDGRTYRRESIIVPIAKIKEGNMWIVVTSVNHPTEEIRRLSTSEKFNLVLVADKKTPTNWSLHDVHFLSIEYQQNLPFKLIDFLPFGSYTRKNIGYLYAVSQGAQWIYDTDDDNKPFGKGLDQFMYEDEISGVRYQVGNDDVIGNRLFNPYRFFGLSSMWPRGFPLEYFKEHTNGEDRMVLCGRMSRPAVQQGLVHQDPDVDAIYRILHADPTKGLNERFNEFTPPITLSPGTYSPWNSQNTLFHISAFHVMFLPTTVSFRTTDIWRSYYAQKILHLSGLTVAFIPVNAIQVRNPHSFLKDFENESQVYTQSGRMVKFLSEWKCFSKKIEDCMIDLAREFVIEGFWEQIDAELVEKYIQDLQKLKFQFPPIVENAEMIEYLKYTSKTNESVIDHNCRRMLLDLRLDLPDNYLKPALIRAQQKVEYFGDVAKWCNQSDYPELLYSMPSPVNVAKEHSKSDILSNNLKNVLIITNNFEWTISIGFLQRLYQPYFALVLFCGTFNQSTYGEMDKGFPELLEPFNYIYMNGAEMNKGYSAYHCMTLAHQMRLQNVQGYYMISDDMHFNIWQRIDFKRVHHLVGLQHLNATNWWDTDYGLIRSEEIIKFIHTTQDLNIKNTWEEFTTRLRNFGYIQANQTASDEMLIGKSWSESDFFYVPSTELDFYARLMHIFFKNHLFHELAVNKFLKTVSHETSLHLNTSYLWDQRESWPSIYSKEHVGLHPMKLSYFAKAGFMRKLYCSTILQTWADVLFNNSNTL